LNEDAVEMEGNTPFGARAEVVETNPPDGYSRDAVVLTDAEIGNAPLKSFESLGAGTADFIAADRTDGKRDPLQRLAALLRRDDDVAEDDVACITLNAVSMSPSPPHRSRS
jgi:hypothetical protein